MTLAPAWEFYDRKKDPQEMNNLINDKNYADEIAEMKQKLKETREKYKDSETLDNQYIELYKDKE